MDNKTIDTYLDYAQKIGDRRSIYAIVVETFNIKSALYAGSHIDISPSFLIPKVIYVDNFKGSVKFFKDLKTITAYIEANKAYKEKSYFKFINQDYNLPLKIEPFDLIISQYAGFVGQAVKAYLKSGGILLCNDSHGDATLARFDNDYKLIGVIDKNNKIVTSDLDSYFVLSKNKEIDLNFVKEKMKGLKYQVVANNYLFYKIWSYKEV